MQPIPLEEIRSRVLAVTPRTRPHVCCICHGQLSGPRDSARLMHLRLCQNPACFAEADALDWLVV